MGYFTLYESNTHLYIKQLLELAYTGRLNENTYTTIETIAEKKLLSLETLEAFQRKVCNRFLEVIKEDDTITNDEFKKYMVLLDFCEYMKGSERLVYLDCAYKENLKCRANINNRNKEFLSDIEFRTSGVLPEINKNHFNLNFHQSEILHYASYGSIIKFKTVSHRIGYSGLSFSFKICKGVRYKVGTVAPSVQKSLEKQIIDQGRIFITNERFVYMGSYKHFQVPISQIASITMNDYGIAIFKEGRENPFTVSSNDYRNILKYLDLLINGPDSLTMQEKVKLKEIEKWSATNDFIDQTKSELSQKLKSAVIKPLPYTIPVSKQQTKPITYTNEEPERFVEIKRFFSTLFSPKNNNNCIKEEPKAKTIEANFSTNLSSQKINKTPINPPKGQRTTIIRRSVKEQLDVNILHNCTRHKLSIISVDVKKPITMFSISIMYRTAMNLEGVCRNIKRTAIIKVIPKTADTKNISSSSQNTYTDKAGIVKAELTKEENSVSADLSLKNKELPKQDSAIIVDAKASSDTSTNSSESTNSNTINSTLVSEEKANSSDQENRKAKDPDKKRLVRKGPKEYKSVILKAQGDSVDFYNPENVAKIITAISTILAKEAPIEYSSLRSKVLNAWGFNRTSSKLDKYFKGLLEQTTTNYTLDNEQKFIWKADQDPNSYTIYRNAGSRTLKEIPSQEIINAAYIAIKDNGSMDKQELLREVANRFGCTKFTKIAESHISLAIEKALLDNTLKTLSNGKIAR